MGTAQFWNVCHLYIIDYVQVGKETMLINTTKTTNHQIASIIRSENNRERVKYI